MDFLPQSDDLAAILSSPSGQPTESRIPAGYAPQSFTERCRKCGGSGVFRGYSGRVVGQCFTCKGAGKFAFKTSPETRAKAQTSRCDKAVRDLAANVDSFITGYPAVHAWLIANPSEFATSLLSGVAKYGSLTEKQLAAVERNIARDATKVEREASAPVVASEGVDRLKQAFDAAVAYAAAKATGLTIRNPKITIGGMTISPARATSKNPGALYVRADATYLGKIADGKFFASRDCSTEQEAQVLAFVSDPAQAAKAYGQETGVCCVCNAELKSEWRLRGIGPICAKKFGW